MFSLPLSFGLLERPSLPPHLIPELISYKVFLSGKAGVGKTSTVAKLVGLPVPTTHSETPGIVTYVVYWPVKLLHSDKVLLFRLQFWDAGENAIRKFEHILPACKSGADAILNLFSFTDRLSFEDLQSQMSRSSQSGEHVIRMVVGTKYDLYSNSEITTRELQNFQEQWKVPILKIKNSGKPAGNELLYSVDSMQEVHDVATVMHSLLEYIWIQKKISSGELRPEDLITRTDIDGKNEGELSDELEASYV
ncbi:ciliogenesis and planar polarity effector 2-like isoform X2 [Patiria miniata]|uniref:Ciliogenesis and planar polarity effector 2 n=1 Tax=Patiria miniata TaxID=46514 RepID=A0A914BTX7_PATMI|nr:ciliogenesis and planar polarity effector 2-like isoform X2 [Patiria miniata]